MRLRSDRVRSRNVRKALSSIDKMRQAL